MSQTQHEDALQIAEQVDAFRKKYPHDHPRLLREYAELCAVEEEDETD